MTNAEKYKEVFGFPPDFDTCPTECKFCPIRQQGVNCIQNIESCGKWWNSEYKEREQLKPTKDLITDIVGFDISGLIEPLPEFKESEEEDGNSR